MTNTVAKIIAHSKSQFDTHELITFELEYPRFIHAELMTHRVFSRNSASSRAIPVKDMIANISNNPAVPHYWGKNQPGMQAAEEHDAEVTPISVILSIQAIHGCSEDEARQILREKFADQDPFSPVSAWKAAMAIAIAQAQEFADAGYHKQVVNRITEPYQMIKVVVSATSFDNWFWLRKHKDADPAIQLLAEKMWEAYNASEPVKLNKGEWHTPYYKDGYWTPSDDDFTLEQALKISSSCTAQVSYRKTDDSLQKAEMVYDRLVTSEPVHASPTEHQGTPFDPVEVSAKFFLHGEWTEGITSLHKELGFMSGNFAGWIQHRQLIPNNTCWSYEDAQAV